MTSLTEIGRSNSTIGASQVLDSIDGWLSSSHLIELVVSFGGHLEGGSTEERLDYLERFSANHWDFRGGRERHQVVGSTFDADINEAIMRAAKSMQMVGTMDPMARTYSHVIVLGGQVRACLVRPARAAELIRQGLTTRTVVAATAFRELLDDETKLARANGLQGVNNEYEAMRAGMARAFDLAPEDLHIETANLAEGHHMSSYGRWSHPTFAVDLVVGPSRSDDPEKRANTGDTLAYWAPRADVTAADQILVVTSTIYVNQQHCDALRELTLPFGCTVETIGVDTADLAGSMGQVFAPWKYLQEVRSTIRAVQALRASALAVSGT